jgi:hypothetical protein
MCLLKQYWLYGDLTMKHLDRVFLFMLALAFSGPAFAAAFTCDPAQPNSIYFPETEAKFVRFVIRTTSPASEPCIDELEIYGTDPERNLALAESGAKAAASSCLPGHASHKIEHLNDGKYGNSYSWIAATRETEWAQIELPAVMTVSRVAYSRDRNGQYRDRMPVSFEVLVSKNGEDWKQVKKVIGDLDVIQGPSAIPSPPPPPLPLATTEPAHPFRYAVTGEEHAWLKTYGRADISPALVPYNGRVEEYPRHTGDDRIPLPPLPAPPRLDGSLEEAAWQTGSRGTARAAWPYDSDSSPLVETALTAGVHGNRLYIHIETDKVLSRHLAVVATPSWRGCGVVTIDDDGLVFRKYRNRKVEDEKAIEGFMDIESGSFEFSLPLSRFKNWNREGLRIGLGMGGQHTPHTGRLITLIPAPLAIAQTGPCVDGAFPLRICAAGSETVELTGNLPGGKLTLKPGETRALALQAESDPIGPRYDLRLAMTGSADFTLHLFRYDPLGHCLHQTAALLDRLEKKHVPLEEIRNSLAALKEQHTAILARPEQPRDRDRFLEARLLQRRAFFRDPDLYPLEHLLFVKRQQFLPSHNYSVILDAPFRPGGAVCRLKIPRENGAFQPEKAELIPLFETKTGIPRTPMADFDIEKIYFAMRPSEDGYYHVMAMNPDGSDLKQITDGPFHDYWPCPLPDGDLAFISTRCRRRFLCWRPQAAVMFRMNRHGGNMTPLSFANLTEWSPAVMSDGRIIWTRSEYIDKGADFGHTLWTIRPDGAKPELIFGNTIIQPNGYANGREVPGTSEFACTLISHFGDLNGPIALVDTGRSRFDQNAITSITPEVPWPGAPPREECFRDPVPIAKDYFLCSHAPRNRFGLYVIDRFGNREYLYFDPDICSMCPTPFRKQEKPPVLASVLEEKTETAPQPMGEVILRDVYRGIEDSVERGRIKYIRIVEEVQSELEQLDNGEYRADHEPFMKFYASPVDLVNGPSGWPAYVAKAPHGLVPVAEDGSAHFHAPAGKVLYFQALDEDLNEIQRMRSVVQLQPGEKRSCVGCHEHRHMAPPNDHRFRTSGPVQPQRAPWCGKPLSYQEVVQPVLDKHCVLCHDGKHPMGLDLRGTLDKNRVPASYRTLISRGLVNYCDYGWNSGGCEKKAPLTFGVVRSRLWDVLNKGHKNIELPREDMRRLKTWIDLNCPLWPDYQNRDKRPLPKSLMAKSE